MIVLPYTDSASSWRPTDPTVHFLSTGETIESDDPRAAVVPSRHVHLNEVPIGKALSLASAEPLDTWAFTLTNAQGAQRCYHGTFAEASNGKGNSRIEGAVSLSVWCGLPGVARKQQSPRPDPGFTSPIRKVQKHLRKAGDIVATRCMSQPEVNGSYGNKSIQVLNAMFDAHEYVENLTELDPHAASRPPSNHNTVFW